MILRILVFLSFSFYFSNLCFADVYDDFDESQLDTAKWDINGSIDKYTIDGSFLKFATNQPGDELTLISTKVFPGDFEIELAFANYSSSGPSQLFMGIFNAEPSGESDIIQISRATTAFGDHDYFSVWSSFSNTWDWSIPSTASNGYLKISRSGSTIQCSYSLNGINWEIAHEFNDIMLEPVIFFVSIHYDETSSESDFTTWLYSVNVYGDYIERRDVRWWYVQHRFFENKDPHNAAYFSMKDIHGNYLLQDCVSSIQLFDPDNKEVSITCADFVETYEVIRGEYDSINGRWYYDPSIYEENYYKVLFDEPLKSGKYHLIVTDNFGITYHRYNQFDSIEELPIITSKSFCVLRDKNDNLIWKWAIPSEYTPGASTSVLAWVAVFDNHETKKGTIAIKVPTHMGWAFVPSNLLKQFAGEEDTVRIGLQVKSKDNTNRLYTDSMDIQDATACGCDINGDGTIGMEEAIHALQSLSGIR